MSETSYINQALESVGRRYGLAGLRLDDSHNAALHLADGALLTFEWMDRTAQLLMSVVVQKLPVVAEQRLELCQALLWFSCLSRRKGVLALHLPTSQAVLRMTLDTDSLTTDSLDSGIHALLNERHEVLSYLQTANISAWLDSRIGRSKSGSRAAAGISKSIRHPHFTPSNKQKPVE